MDSAILQEKNLIKRAQKDPEAFGALYDQNYDRIFRFIMSRTGNYEVSQDLTAETFFIALKNIWRYRISQKPFSAWLYKIAIAQISNFYRQNSRYCELTLEECPELINRASSLHSFITEKNMDLDKIKQIRLVSFALNKLKKMEHTIIVLRYFEDMSFKQISQTLGIKINTVKSHCHRALKKLNRLFDRSREMGYDFNERPNQTTSRNYFTHHQA